MPPIRQMTDDSNKNCVSIVLRLAPIAFLKPISLVLSLTETNIIFIIPTAPTKRDNPVMNNPAILIIIVIESRKLVNPSC